LQPVYESSDLINFSLSGLKEVSPGDHTYYLLSVYDDAAPGNPKGDDLTGMFSVQFIGDPIPSKVNDPLFENSFSLYPNPTNGPFHIQSTLTGRQDPIAITIMNAFGQQVDHQVNSSLDAYIGDLNEMPDGAYFVRIQQGNRVGVNSILKTEGRK